MVRATVSSNSWGVTVELVWWMETVYPYVAFPV